MTTKRVHSGWKYARRSSIETYTLSNLSCLASKQREHTTRPVRNDNDKGQVLTQNHAIITLSKLRYVKILLSSIEEEKWVWVWQLYWW